MSIRGRYLKSLTVSHTHKLVIIPSTYQRLGLYKATNAYSNTLLTVLFSRNLVIVVLRVLHSQNTLLADLIFSLELEGEFMFSRRKIDFLTTLKNRHLVRLEISEGLIVL